MSHDALSKFFSRERIVSVRAAFGRPAEQAEPWFRVVIAGGGVAAIEAALALQALAADRISVQIIAPGDVFTYRPLEVREPFAGRHAPEYSLAEAAATAGATLVDEAVVSVSPAQQRVFTSDGAAHPYDALILCLGATPVWPLEHARGIRPGQLDETLHGFVQDVEGEYIRTAAVIVPDRVGWPLPAYELALMTAERAAGMSADLSLTLITSEAEPLGMFGRDTSAAVRGRLADAGITLITAAHAAVPRSKVVEITAEGRRTTLEVDAILAAPELVGPALEGLPHDEHGFIPVDAYGRVAGVDRVFAAGDATDGPIKQGGLAAQQAEVVARGAAQLAGAAVVATPFVPEFHGVLLTGGAPLVLGTRAPGATTHDHETAGVALGKIAAPRLAEYLATHEPLATAAR